QHEVRANSLGDGPEFSRPSEGHRGLPPRDGRTEQIEAHGLIGRRLPAFLLQVQRTLEPLLEQLVVITEAAVFGVQVLTVLAQVYHESGLVVRIVGRAVNTIR